MIARVAGAQDLRSGSVRGQHAADGALAAASRVGSETPAVLGKLHIELAMNDARLNANRIGSQFENGTKMFAQIDDDAGA